MSPGSWSAVSINSTKRRQIFMYHRKTVPQVRKKALWSIQRLPFALSSYSDVFSGRNLCPDRLSSPMNKIIICMRMMQISCLAPECILELLRNYIVLELVTLHCTVNESSLGFTTHTAARWSFLQSLQIPVNSQALSLGNVQWLSHFLEHPSTQIMRTSPQSRIMHLLRTT